MSPADQVFAFHYDHTGKLDRLALYRPGTGTIAIVGNVDGTVAPMCAQSASGTEFATVIENAIAIRLLPSDYDHSGKLDQLVFYRARRGAIAILKNTEATFLPVYEGGCIGGYDLRSPSDRAFAFDYERSGYARSPASLPAQHRHHFDLRTSAVPLRQFFEGKGIGGYDLTSANDGPIAFDYDQNGMSDHLFLYGRGHASSMSRIFIGNIDDTNL